LNIQERIAALRQMMRAHKIDAYIIPSADNHQSEYVGEHFKCRAFLSGFTGSAGDIIVTQTSAGLWSDARYFLQAESQLENTGITLYKMGEPNVPTMEDFLTNALPMHGVLGFDGRVIAMQKGQNLAKTLASKQIDMQHTHDFIDTIWSERPPLSKEPAFSLDEKYTGESTHAKLTRIRLAMKEVGATTHIISSLDDICWILNMRGNDIEYSPLILSYLIIRENCVDLFIDEEKLDSHAKETLTKCNFTFHPYNNIYKVVKTFTDMETILIDPQKTNYAIYKSISENVKIIEKQNPSILFKAIKNEIELQNIKNAHIQDGVAVTKFMYWLKTTIGKEKITECSATKKLESFRRNSKSYLGQSFSPICGYKEHAAIVHYCATPETDKVLEPVGLFLTDTGGNYYEGSTDITRTHVLGALTNEERLHFTAVAKSNLNLANARFLYGCSGYNLDILARQPLWALGLDYKHGTGHGVGYLLSIHEGPASLRWQLPPDGMPQVLESGMVLTNEPALYVSDSHGVRTENEMIVRADKTNTYGQFLYFETITYVPIDLDGINPSLMNQDEKNLLNNYHKLVYSTIAPYLSKDEKAWLQTYTKEI